MAAIDYFPPAGLTSPAVQAEAVTPSNTVDLVNVSRALWVGVAGDVKVTMASGQAVTFTALTIGWHPLRVSRVWSTGTTATNITAVS